MRRVSFLIALGIPCLTTPVRGAAQGGQFYFCRLTTTANQQTTTYATQENPVDQSTAGDANLTRSLARAFTTDVATARPTDEKQALLASAATAPKAHCTVGSDDAIDDARAYLNGKSAGKVVFVTWKYAAPAIASAPAAPPPSGAAVHAASYTLPPPVKLTTLHGFCFSDISSPVTPTVYFSADFEVQGAPRNDPHAIQSDPALNADLLNDLQKAFLAFLAQRYAYKTSAAYPTSCTTAVDVDSGLRDRLRRNAPQAKYVETGWTPKDLVPTVWCDAGWAGATGNTNTIYFTGDIPQNGYPKDVIAKAFYAYLQQTYGYASKAVDFTCSAEPDVATSKAARAERAKAATGSHHPVKETEWLP